MPRSDASLDDFSNSSYDSDEEYRLAQEDWVESMRQLNQLFAVVLLPFFGKWLGRRWSHWLYGRYLQVGLSRALFWGKFTPTP